MENVAVYFSLVSVCLAGYAVFLAWGTARLLRRDRDQDREGRTRWFQRYGDLDRDLLLEVVREVHALREAKMRELHESVTSPRASSYGQVYKDTAFLTHNNAGPSHGWQKLILAFRGDSPLGWSELSHLRRIGFDHDELSAYETKAQEAELYT